jgi:NAD(P)-dependent dehydrogenase (short-subunit alcohol dehydrogenase family)
LDVSRSGVGSPSGIRRIVLLSMLRIVMGMASMPRSEDNLRPLNELISLKGKKALITGAAAGIGRAMAYRFAEAGSGLHLVDINEGDLVKLERELKGNGIDVSTHVVDLSKKSEIDNLWMKLKREEPEILVNNAGVYPVKPFLKVDEEFLNKVFNINLNSVFWMCQHMVSAREHEGGTIINIGTIEAILPFKEGLMHYTTSKAGVIALTRDLAREYGKKFRANVLVPGGIVTQGTKNVAKGLLKMEVGLIGDGIKFNARLPIGRFGKPDEVALMALVLASGLSSYVNGAIVPVDGGFLSN